MLELKTVYLSQLAMMSGLSGGSEEDNRLLLRFNVKIP